MNIYGYTEGSDELLKLIDLTIQVNENELRRLAQFFLKCAESIDSDDWEHEHLSDFLNDMSFKPDIIVAK